MSWTKGFLLWALIGPLGATAQDIVNRTQFERREGVPDSSLRGVYQVEAVPASSPNSGIEGFRPGPRPFRRAHLSLVDDGFQVQLYPAWHKTSLRPPEEWEDFQGREVIVRGRPQDDSRGAYIEPQDLRLAMSEGPEFAARSLLETLESWSAVQLRGWRFLSQTEAAPGQDWDLSRTYQVDIDRSYQLRLFRFPAGPASGQPAPGRAGAAPVSVTPAHVGRLQLSWEGFDTGPRVAPLLARLAWAAFDANTEQSNWLASLLVHPESGSSRLGNLRCSVERAERGMAITLDCSESPRTRRVYADLEPRSLSVEVR